MTAASQHIRFAAYCILVALLGVSSLWDLVALGQANTTASHHALVPLVSVVLVCLGRQSIFQAVRLDRLAGAIVMGAGLTLWLVARLVLAPQGQADVLAISTAALVVLWIGGFFLFYGRTAGRRALFPLLFLGFMVPIPAVALDAAVLFLKIGSTETVSALFTLTGTPFFRDGFVFTLPHAVIEVADECSGIRSSIGLLLTSLLAGYLFLKTGWRKSVLVAAVVPLAILKNGIRIVTLSLLSLHVDREYLTGQLHHEGGIVFFLLALALAAPLLALLQRTEPHQVVAVTRP